MKKILVILILTLCVGGIMAQLQDKIKPAPAWATFMGCTKACSDYLGFNYSQPWLYGSLGFAWLLNVHAEACPSGPTAFDNSFLTRNAAVLGLSFETVSFAGGDSLLAQKQKAAWESIAKAAGEGQPCFGWELDIPEYYLLAGTDDKGYLYFDFDGSVKSCPWERIATSDIGMGEFYILSRGKEPPNALGQAKAALGWLREYQAKADSYALEGYTMGTAGYDVLINALKASTADHWGLPYNLQVWGEARACALAYLKELKAQLGEGYDYARLDKAINYFGLLSEALQGAAALYSFPPRDDDFTSENALRAIELLTRARDAEKTGLKYLLEFAGTL